MAAAAAAAAEMFTVEVTSQETVKPSSPTPPHLQTHSLSWFDQLAPPSHVPLLLFYSPPPSPVLQSLKRSLSQTLSLFPLLAGRLENEASQIRCGDQGVEFFEARVDSTLSHLQQQQLSLQSLDALLPCDRSCSCWGQALLAVQINTLSCGSVVIGICVAHKIADGLSLANFVTAWAAAAAGGGGGDIPRPNLGAASLFPPSEKANLALASVKWSLKPTKKLLTKRFLFDEANLAALRGSSSTRVEAVAALVWRCAMRARPEEAAARVSLAFVVVDVRGRMEPPLDGSSFGNLCIYAAASEVEAGDEGAKRRTEVKLRNGIKKIDKEYLGQLQGADGPLLAFEKGREAAREHGKGDDDVDDIDIYYFNSWARFPVYEADFGWGKPVWAGTARFFWKNLIMLMGRGGDGGMEAWVTLEEEEMVKFEKDQELVSYATSLASIAA
ncbi:stemmadenine O-acetyltransferase-like [Phoenix dactylifera]|uniref:Stemmadenine O-acetyltransferase-like n=1 Tax=Phoenix dactylifera TaxID=42345 RepID=A0A8B9ASD6_PHODC|nr:stemmadenine O-acetyltransferase-like [Phoenix dactylifera]XP_038989711.1 stemmadenine O-acetyltransferase-like [Phoenix dactylifera]